MDRLDELEHTLRRVELQLQVLRYQLDEMIKKQEEQHEDGS